jgi:glycosyltransferase involved in cell wall biosynthesis
MTVNGHTNTEPVSTDGTKLETVRWVLENGVPAESYVNLGLIFHTQTPPILREADVAVFPNRSEGGTNMVALECLACGVPTVLSANTGHLDLTDPAHCYPLTRQAPCAAPRDYLDVTDWGESSVEELVEILEAVYTDRAEARRRADNAVSFMHARPWSKQIGEMLDVMADG